jgi:hypothetical protein
MSAGLNQTSERSYFCNKLPVSEKEKHSFWDLNIDRFCPYQIPVAKGHYNNPDEACEIIMKNTPYRTTPYKGGNNHYNPDSDFPANIHYEPP